eukprot:13968036-Alexandrium_andersonii.AAC.1
MDSKCQAAEATCEAGNSACLGGLRPPQRTPRPGLASLGLAGAASTRLEDAEPAAGVLALPGL